LLSRSGGLPTDDAWADRQESMSDCEFDRLAGNGFRFARRPGSGYEYSNLGYALVGRAVQVAAGRPYVEFVTEELLGPLGLDQIAYHAGVPATDGVATGFRRSDPEWVALPFTGPGAFSPIGGLFATPRALARWVCWLAGGNGVGEATPQDAVLGAGSRREMATAQTPIAGSPGAGTDSRGYGYGLVVEESSRHGRIVSHSGGYPGFGAHFRWHADSGIGIVAMENATYSGTIVAAEAALTLMLDETAVPDAEPELWPETIAAREAVERLLRSWDPAAAAALFADNVELDEPLGRRREKIGARAAAAGIAGAPIVPLRSASPMSNSPAHLVWTSPGADGSLRCEISLTPQSPPLVQTLTVHPG
jgi:CubicO group peptidase (beta-lactamase class C family)